ncbi:Uma2 family endonuclease [Planctomicrobium piriforme]|uniref:Endonuclease, Uma2 family (Restriction endonuclease fold) n=1 Tax=Planctomicrobium piriforme TaxID=1576369 RepID=A0A1I3DFU2_9PLAN|nr:Uma2 family endonuclease [Planctomicrobium piriforme]SFH85516.1 Endonuclease, Uma2 family (restriction endonuclease fold) [Planctomicrobium piriforme]
MATLTQLLTAEEYARLPNSGAVTELVRGEIVQLNQPSPRHGQVCGNAYFLIRQYLEQSPSGHLVTNDSGIITARDPDTVRGGDVWFVSYSKVPRGRLPQGYLRVAPDVVFEVKSPSDRWPQVYSRIAEFLEIGVSVVCLVDPDEEAVRTYHDIQPPARFAGDELVTFPELLPGFETPASRFFA